MRDVRQTRHKLQQLRNNLLSTDTNRCTSDLAIRWKFLHSDPFVNPIIADLERHEVSYQEWREEHTEDGTYRGGYDLPHDEDKRAALCLAILSPTNFTSDDDVWKL